MKYFLFLFVFVFACESNHEELEPSLSDDYLTTTKFDYTLYDEVGTGYRKRSAFAVIKVNTDAASLDVSFYSPVVAEFGSGGKSIGTVSIYDKNWEFVNTVVPDATNDLQIKNVLLDGTGVRDFYLVEGGNSSYGLSSFKGTYIQAIQPVDGVLEISQIPKATNRIVSVGNSISIGDGSSLASRYAWPVVLRDLLRDDDWSLTLDGWGGAYTNGLAGNELLQQEMKDRIVLEFSGATGKKVILWTLGTNDFGYVVSDPKVVANNAACVWDKAYAADSEIEVMLITPLWRGNQNTPNSGGWMLQDYRDALNLEAKKRSFVTVYNGEAILSSADFTRDALHPNNSGHRKIANFISTELWQL